MRLKEVRRGPVAFAATICLRAHALRERLRLHPYLLEHGREGASEQGLVAGHGTAVDHRGEAVEPLAPRLEALRRRAERPGRP